MNKKRLILKKFRGVNKKLNKQVEKELIERFTNPNYPGSFSGISKFQNYNKDLKLDKNNLQEWLMSRDEYTLHRPIHKKHETLKVQVGGIDDLWQADLIDVKNLASENDGIKFLLTCIDVFSKYAWVVTIKNKSATTVFEAFKEIMKSGRKPKKLQTDKGNEFFNNILKEYLKKHEIELYATYSDEKSSVVERFNRTLKEKLWKYFTFSESNVYFKVLPQIVEAYNNSKHRSIKEAPIKVNEKNEKEIYKNLYGYYKQDGNDNYIKQFKFKVGDSVRIAKYKTHFEKGYTSNWTIEVFKISKVLPTYPPTYNIIDSMNEEVQGLYYENELQKVYKLDNIYKIEKIISVKGKAPNRKYFVKWKGYSEKFNSWIDEKDYDV